MNHTVDLENQLRSTLSGTSRLSQRLDPAGEIRSRSTLSTLAGYFPGAGSFLTSRCAACSQQLAGSAFLSNLNAAQDTVPGVQYTVIECKYDEVVTPYTSAFLSGPNVTNILLENQCPLDLGEHLSMPYDHIADADVLTALDPGHPQHSACTSVLPITGGWLEQGSAGGFTAT